MFQLHERLAEDCIPLGSFSLSRLLLMNDANYPWCILVPAREGLCEVHDLEPQELRLLVNEMGVVSKNLSRAFEADKINVASLGNIVPQLHIHVIARFRGDPAWPHPVWGRLPAQPYRAEELQRVKDRLQVLATEGCRFD